MAPLIIAHRGDSAHYPENTLASFASALEVGAQIVEFDVQLTRDGTPVVIHDPTLDRTTTGTGPVREKTLAEARAVSAGYPRRFGSAHAGERVPTLAEVLAFLRGRARMIVEIKTESVRDDPGESVETLTVAEVRKAGLVGEVAFLSFDRRALVRCREQAPEIPRGRPPHSTSGWMTRPEGSFGWKKVLLAGIDSRASATSTICDTGVPRSSTAERHFS